MAVSSISITQITGAILWQDTAQADAAVVLKAASAVVYMVDIDNTMNAAEAEYVRVFNTAGAVVVGTTDPSAIWYVPAAAKLTLVFPEGLTFGTGLQIATVNTAAVAGHTPPTVPITVKVVYV